MGRIIIGAGTGYLLGLFFVALTTSGGTGSTEYLEDAAIFVDMGLYNRNPHKLMLACVAVGAVMGWAWHTIAIDAGSKDD